jgi:hypothetical protein
VKKKKRKEKRKEVKRQALYHTTLHYTNLSGYDPFARSFIEIGLHRTAHVLIRIVSIGIQPIQQILPHLISVW